MCCGESESLGDDKVSGDEVCCGTMMFPISHGQSECHLSLCRVWKRSRLSC